MSNASGSTSQVQGDASLTIVWPSQPKAGSSAQPALIPIATNSIKIVLTSTTNRAITFSKTLNRPTTGTTTSTTFNVPGDTYTVTATAYPQAAGVGTALASGTDSITIQVGQTTNLTVNMTSTIATLKITPAAPSVAVGATTPLAAAGYDASGAMVLLTPSKLTWTSSATSVATVNSSGLVSAVKAGNATITVKDSESLKSAMASFTVTSSSGGGKPFYTLIDLGANSAAYAISSAGLVVGESGNASDASLWQNGQIIDLGIPKGYTDINATDVNDAGQVVGIAHSPTGIDAFLWTKVKGFIILPTFIATISSNEVLSVGINNSGKIYVTAEDAYQFGEMPRTALFQYSSGQVTYITQFWLSASAINAAGQIAGTNVGGVTSTAERVDSDGISIIAVGSLGGTANFGSGINSLGQVVGTSLVINQINHAFFWDQKTGIKDLGTLGGNNSSAVGINSSGQIIGSSENAAHQQPSFVYSRGVMYDLSTLLDPISSVGWSAEVVTGIDDKGQICGYGSYKGQTHAFLLTPK